MTATPRVLALLAPVVSSAGYDLEDLGVTAAGRRSVVRVVVDRDGGIDLDDVADVSRTVSDALDALDEAEPDALGATYVLEVTSPGVDRPLTEPRHWRRNVGRLVTATLADGEPAHRPVAVRRRAGRAARRRRDRARACRTPTSCAGASRSSSTARTTTRTTGRRGRGAGAVKIDMAALRSLEREKEISFDTRGQAIETALLTAYRHTEGAQPHARVELDRTLGRGRRAGAGARRGRRASPASATTPPRASAGSPRAPPSRSSCSGCATPSSELTYGEYAGREGDIVSGVVQQAQRPGAPPNRNVMVQLGRRTARGRPAAGEQVPGEVYEHGTRLKCYVVSVARGQRGAVRHRLAAPTRTWCAGCSRSRCPRSPTARSRSSAIAREAGHRTKIAVRRRVAGLNAKGACIGPIGQRVRNVDDRAARREDRHRRLRRTTRRASSRNALSPAAGQPVQVVDPVARSARVVVPDYQLSLAIGKEGQNARLAARLTGWRIDIHSDAERRGDRRRDAGEPEEPVSRSARTARAR